MEKQELIEKWENKASAPSCEISASSIRPSEYEMYTVGYGVARVEIIEDLKRLDEPQKVKVPAFVAEYIIWCHSEGLTLWKVFKTIRGMPEKVWKWLKDEDHQAVFSKAYTDGYEVEEEPLFYIRLTIPSSSVVGLYLGFNKDGIFDHSYGKPHVTWDWKCTFTEHEIKSIDERLWTFAVPVEKV